MALKIPLLRSGGFFWVLLLVVLVYANGLRGPFQFDDVNVIVHNPAVHGLAAWTAAPVGIRPLLKLSYALNWQFSTSAIGFHLLNLGLHLLNSALFWRFLLLALPLEGPAKERAALIAALLWALHPAATEAVTYISGRSVSLMTMFWLAALLAVQRQAMGRAAVWTALALVVRETAWVIPFSLVLVLVMQGEGLRRTVKRCWPVFAVVGLAALLFVLDGAYRQELTSSFAARPLAVQLLSQANALHYFLVGPVLGLTPNLDPDIPVQSAVDGRWLAEAVVFGGVLWAVAVSFYRRRGWVAGGLLWFLLALLPTNSLFPRLDLASDRHLYPALLGPAWALGLLLARPLAGRVAVVILVVVFATATLIRNEDYRSSYALWLRTVQQSPGKARPWNNLGYACEQGGDVPCALGAYARASLLDPADSRARLNWYFLEKRNAR